MAQLINGRTKCWRSAQPSNTDDCEATMRLLLLEGMEQTDRWTVTGASCGLLVDGHIIRKTLGVFGCR